MSCFAKASNGYHNVNAMFMDGWMSVTLSTVSEWDGARIETVSHIYNLDYPARNLTKGLNDLEDAMSRDSLEAPWFEVVHEMRWDLAR